MCKHAMAKANETTRLVKRRAAARHWGPGRLSARKQVPKPGVAKTCHFDARSADFRVRARARYAP